MKLSVSEVQSSTVMPRLSNLGEELAIYPREGVRSPSHPAMNAWTGCGEPGAGRPAVFPNGALGSWVSLLLVAPLLPGNASALSGSHAYHAASPPGPTAAWRSA